MLLCIYANVCKWMHAHDEIVSKLLLCLHRVGLSCQLDHRWQCWMCVQTVRFKNELERNITIKLGYANAKVMSSFISFEFRVLWPVYFSLPAILHLQTIQFSETVMLCSYCAVVKHLSLQTGSSCELFFADIDIFLLYLSPFADALFQSTVVDVPPIFNVQFFIDFRR